MAPFAAAWRIASAACRIWRAASASSGRCCSRVSCSSRRASCSSSSASCRCDAPPPPPPLLLLRRRRPALALDFLLLPACELLQFLREFVHLLVAALLLGALLHLVLVRELVELELEQIREILGELVLGAAAAPAAAALTHLHLVVLFGVLQQLQRALLRRQRFLRLLRLEVAFGGFHFRGRFRQRVGDGFESRIDHADTRLKLADELVHLRAQLRLREVEEHDVLAELLRLQLRPCRARR